MGRPLFNILPEKVQPTREAFNELVEFYNQLADQVEDDFIIRHIRNTVFNLLDSGTQQVLMEVEDAVRERINAYGYDAYRKKLLQSGRAPLEFVA